MGKRKRSGSFSKYDDGSKRSDDGDSQEEMDGEALVANKGNIVNGIRYSARVQEKQEKLRREASPSKQTVADSTSVITVAVPCQSTTKPTTFGEDVLEVAPVESTFVPQTVSISGEKKKKRTWELWSQEDKQLFFEALNEYGKDFDAIQSYLAAKLKPRSKGSCSQAVPKNKDQVRHFYYRTWNKISKYLTFPKDMKKAFQELYGLINYGELRKKQRVLSSKTAVKLSELVERGTTTIKVRGKTFRIKTPVCRALKRLNQLEDVDHIRVPCKLCVELLPSNGDTWASVQRVSHNPRIKVFAPLQRTLASLIIYFEERWKNDQSRLKEEFSLTVFGKPKTRLRFIPADNRDLSVPIFKFSETTSASKISLSSYVRNCMYQERSKDATLLSKNIKRKPKPAGDSEYVQGAGCTSHRDCDYLAAETDLSDADGCEAVHENQLRITLRKDKANTGVPQYVMKPSEFYGDHDNSNGFPDTMWCVHEENANAATETDAAETDYGFDENAPSPTECDENTGDEDCMDPAMPDHDILYGSHDHEGREEKQCTCVLRSSTEVEDVGSEKQDKQCTCGTKKMGEAEEVKCQLLDAETIARGWTAEEAGTITLGEIYLMLGKSDKLCFEYMWDKSDEDKMREDRARNLVEKLVNVARQLKKRKTNRAKSSTSVVTSVSCNTPLVCMKCSLKIESPGTSEGEPSSTTPDATATLQLETPQRNHATVQQNSDISEENKITLHAATPVHETESPVKMDFPVNESNTVESTLVLNSEQAEVKTNPESELAQTHKEDPCGQNQSVATADSIISLDKGTNPSSVCSIPPVVTQQTGKVDISTLTSSTDLDSTFRRAGTNIQATIIPTSTTIIRSVALTTLSDSQKASLGSCQSTTITPVAATTTVLVSEPAMFAGITTEASPFVTIQPCTATCVSPPPPQNTQETKFRRPADVPILMKPTTDDKSTNEDGSPKISVPKPFLDLPKGNRRIGRRPAWKQRVIIPRMLPLLPKPDESLMKTAAMTTLIAIPPVMATGISVVPVSTESLTPLSSLHGTVGQETVSSTTTFASSTVTLASGVAVAVSSILSPVTSTENTTVNSTLVSRNTHFVSSASSSLAACSSSEDKRNISADRVTFSKSSEDVPARATSSGFEETLDNISLSSFMDISIPESTRFIASDLRLDELEYSNSSMSLGGMGEESGRKNTRDPPLLDTPKKHSNSGDSQVDIPSPPRLTPLTSLETSWPSMNEGSDLFMGGLFGGHDTLRSSGTEEMEGDLNFQSVMGENSLDFDSKLNEFSTHMSDNNKE